MPKAGDSGITCEECGRYLDFRKDMTANIAASITGAVRKHYPPEIAGDYAERFGAAFRAAWNAACPPRRIDWHNKGQQGQRLRLRPREAAPEQARPETPKPTRFRFESRAERIRRITEKQPDRTDP